MFNNNNKGFTLYELLTTMLIISIVLSIGIPNFAAFRQNSRMTAAVNDLHSSFYLARTEASRSKDNITICASFDSGGVAPNCDPGAQFEDGWIVFQDTDASLSVNGGEAVLKRFPPLAVNISVISNGTLDYFTYAPTGQGRTINGEIPISTAILCDDRGNRTAAGGRSAARVLVVTPLGRATILKDVTQIAAQGGCP